MKIYIGIIIIGVLLLPFFISFSVKKTTGLNLTDASEKIYFYEDKMFKKTFISPKNNLNSVVLKLKNAALRNQEQVIFRMLEEGKVIREEKINGYNIKDEDWVRFAFEVVPNSYQKEFEMELVSPNSKINNAIAVYINNSGIPGIITYHTLSSRKELILQIYSDLYKRLTQDGWFLIFWFVLLVFVYFITSLFANAKRK